MALIVPVGRQNSIALRGASRPGSYDLLTLMCASGGHPPPPPIPAVECRDQTQREAIAIARLQQWQSCRDTCGDLQSHLKRAVPPPVLYVLWFLDWPQQWPILLVSAT
jgi:hypothetical protein